MSTKEEVFNYVMKSPENTNPAVLKSMLDRIESSGNNNNDLFINFVSTLNEETGKETIISADKTYADITNALQEHKWIHGLVTRNIEEEIYYLDVTYAGRVYDEFFEQYSYLFKGLGYFQGKSQGFSKFEIYIGWIWIDYNDDGEPEDYFSYFEGEIEAN